MYEVRLQYKPKKEIQFTEERLRNFEQLKRINFPNIF